MTDCLQEAATTGQGREAMEIRKGYSTKVRGEAGWRSPELQDELYALFKFAWLENARLLPRRKGAHCHFLLSFLTQPEAARFAENFARNRPSALSLEPLEVADTRGFVPWGSVVPWDVAAELTARRAAAEDLHEQVMDSLIQRDREKPKPNLVKFVVALRLVIKNHAVYQGHKEPFQYRST